MGTTQTDTRTMLCHACQQPARWIDAIRRPFCARHVQMAFTQPDGRPSPKPKLRPVS